MHRNKRSRKGRFASLLAPPANFTGAELKGVVPRSPKAEVSTGQQFEQMLDTLMKTSPKRSNHTEMHLCTDLNTQRHSQLSSRHINGAPSL